MHTRQCGSGTSVLEISLIDRSIYNTIHTSENTPVHSVIFLNSIRSWYENVPREHSPNLRSIPNPHNRQGHETQAPKGYMAYCSDIGDNVWCFGIP